PVQSNAKLLVLTLPVREFVEGIPEDGSVHFLLDVAIDDIVIRSKNIGKEQFIAIPVDIQGFVKGDFGTHLVVSPKIHQNFIFDATGSVSSQLDPLGGIKGVDGFDQADGPNGNQVFDVDPGIFKLARNVDNQPKVALNQHSPNSGVSAGELLQQKRLFL